MGEGAVSAVPRALDRLQGDFSSFRPGCSAQGSGQHRRLLTQGRFLWSKTRNQASQMQLGWATRF